MRSMRRARSPAGRVPGAVAGAAPGRGAAPPCRAAASPAAPIASWPRNCGAACVLHRRPPLAPTPGPGRFYHDGCRAEGVHRTREARPAPTAPAQAGAAATSRFFSSVDFAAGFGPGRRVAGLHLELDLGLHAALHVDLLVEDEEAALVDGDPVLALRQPEVGRVAVEVAGLAHVLPVDPDVGPVRLHVQLHRAQARHHRRAHAHAALGLVVRRAGSSPVPSPSPRGRSRTRGCRSRRPRRPRAAAAAPRPWASASGGWKASAPVKATATARVSPARLPFVMSKPPWSGGWRPAAARSSSKGRAARGRAGPQRALLTSFGAGLTFLRRRRTSRRRALEGPSESRRRGDGAGRRSPASRAPSPGGDAGSRAKRTLRAGFTL